MHNAQPRYSLLSEHHPSLNLCYAWNYNLPSKTSKSLPGRHPAVSLDPPNNKPALCRWLLKSSNYLADEIVSFPNKGSSKFNLLPRNGLIEFLVQQQSDRLLWRYRSVLRAGTTNSRNIFNSQLKSTNDPTFVKSSWTRAVYQSCLDQGRSWLPTTSFTPVKPRSLLYTNKTDIKPTA